MKNPSLQLKLMKLTARTCHRAPATKPHQVSNPVTQISKTTKKILVRNEHLTATVARADDDERAEGKDAEEQTKSLSKENHDQFCKTDNTSLTQTGYTDGMPRVLGTQNTVFPEIDMALEQTRKKDLFLAAKYAHRVTRYAYREDTYNDPVVEEWDRCRELVGTRHRSVAECRCVKRSKGEPASAVIGQSATKAMRTAADWKRRKKKREARSERITMAS